MTWYGILKGKMAANHRHECWQGREMKQDFIRARSSEQKSQRMADIKQATAQLYREFPYHEITLTTIAERLGWSRASLYKYVTTKEEIFLELSADARNAYYEDLLAAFPPTFEFNASSIAAIWAQIAEANKDWFVYGDILMTIIETNVTLERLKLFKKGYFDYLDRLYSQMGEKLGVSKDRFNYLISTIHYHGTGMVGGCATNPIVAQALEELGIDNPKLDFKASMEEFICMCLHHWHDE